VRRAQEARQPQETEKQQPKRCRLHHPSIEWGNYAPPACQYEASARGSDASLNQAGLAKKVLRYLQSFAGFDGHTPPRDETTVFSTAAGSSSSGSLAMLAAIRWASSVDSRAGPGTLLAVFLKSRVDIDAADTGPRANGRPCTQRRVLASMLDVDWLYDDPFATGQFPKRATRRPPVDVVGARDATLDGAAGLLGLSVGDGLFDGAADRELICSHSMWTVNGRAMSPTSAGDNCCSDRAVWYAIPLLSKNVRATSALSAKFTFCGTYPVNRAMRTASSLAVTIPTR